MPPLNFDESQIGCHCHFLDSGSFSFWSQAAEYAKLHKTEPFAFYSTKEFKDYVDDYAEFVKKGSIAIDYYSNVDVIPNPELSWRNLKYLENKHGLKPIPVIHYPTPHSWITKHLENGYRYIALGGLVGSHAMEVCRQWIDKAFDIVCATKTGTPGVRVHGFGVTSYELLLRYPWFSVDSSYWTKQGAFGRILVPHKRKGLFVFTEQPHSIAVSNGSPQIRERNNHYFTISLAERAVVDEWLEYIGVNLGATTLEGEIAEAGVTNNHSYRKAANIYFFREMLKHLPDYPWAFKSKTQRTGGFKLEGI